MDARTAYLATLALGLAAAACSGSGHLEDVEPPQAAVPMAFSGQCAADSGASRGYAVTGATLREFAVSATVYSPSGSRSLYFAHEIYRVPRPGHEVDTTVAGAVHYWLGSDKEYNFYAYTPSPCIDFAPGVVDRFVFTAPPRVAEQPDIVVATAVAAPYGRPVALEFVHPLAMVSLAEGAVMRPGRIVSVTFSGIVARGEYNMLTAEWTMLSSDTGTFTWLCDTPSRPSHDLSGELYNFFFVPQRLGPDAAFTVAFEDLAGIVEIHRVPLSGTWLPGRRYRYTLTLA